MHFYINEFFNISTHFLQRKLQMHDNQLNIFKKMPHLFHKRIYIL